MRRIVGEIGIHLEDEVVALTQSPLESSNVCGAEAHLVWPLEDIHPRLVLHDTIDDLASAVRRTIIDDENLEAIILLEDGTNEARDVLALVVRRNNDECPFSHLTKITLPRWVLARASSRVSCPSPDYSHSDENQ